MSVSHIRLANKYRPTNLDEIVGQDFLISTLIKAIELNKVADVFLFSGSYGTGKTSTARVMAKTINCLRLKAYVPCNNCTSCIAVDSNSHPDITEVDAASNTGVEEIRILIDGVLYKPLISHYNVYIIDEVHMLSQSAFNALLKVLEEPPKHVKFFLATTELQKIPMTVVSRCQHFRLSRLSPDIISQKLTHVSDIENFDIDIESINFISENSHGSLRDALSILEQISLSSGEKKITLNSVRKNLGLLDCTSINNLFASIEDGNAKNVLTLFRSFYQQGHDPITVLEELLKLLNMLIQKELSNQSCSKLEYYISLSQSMLKAIEEIKLSDSSLYVMEIILMRMCFIGTLPSMNQILQSIHKTHPSENALADYVVQTFKNSKIISED